MESWEEVGDGIYVRRHRSVLLNCGLVVGDGGCLVIDTRATYEQGRELAEAVRAVTPHPWTVLNTHAHWDHFFGNAAFRPAPVWGCARCAEVARDYGHVQRAAMASYGGPLAEAVAATEVDPPDRTFEGATTLDIGGRPVELRYLGRGHTDSDVVALVDDVVFAGDLVEEGGPPAFDDSFPHDWPATASALVGLVRGPVVPGHGQVVDLDFVRAQQQELAAVAEAARAGADPARGPYPVEVMRAAYERAERQTAGAPPYDAPADLLEELRKR